ncbi:LacI family DNA-binding transcriptional regulator [Candidatus Margulisiibacteriota bacterium]
MPRKKKVTIKKIAKEAGVSAATVSQTFNHPREVNRKTRELILQICHHLGYTHRKAHGKRKKNIVVLSLDRYIPFTDFYGYVSIGIIEQARKEKINVIFEPYRKEQEELPLAVSKNIIDGVLVMGPLPRTHILSLNQRNIPMVLCGHPIPGLELNTVVPDGRAGMYEATKHLISLGHKKIAFITGAPIFDPVVADRLEGYRFAMFEAGMDIPKEYIVKADFVRYEKSTEAADKLLDLKNPPTAIIAISDPIAFVVYKHLIKKGIQIPKELSLVGFDNIPKTLYTAPYLPELTTVYVNAEELGRTSVRVLLDVVENPSRAAYRHTLPVHLMVKGSTRQL